MTEKNYLDPRIQGEVAAVAEAIARLGILTQEVQRECEHPWVAEEKTTRSHLRTCVVCGYHERTAAYHEYRFKALADKEPPGTPRGFLQTCPITAQVAYLPRNYKDL